jgi:condensin complex subunit 2
MVAPEPEHNAGYDADFFADNDTGGFGDVDDGETFADARDRFSPGAVDHSTALPDGTQNEEFGSLLRARRARPDYVNYAKTAKKVDVKKLKDNLWTKLDLEVSLPVFPVLSFIHFLPTNITPLLFSRFSLRQCLWVD